MAYHLLPTEILVKIFGYLKVSDRLCAFLVCKDWYGVSSHPHMTKDIAYVLRDDTSSGMYVLKENRRHMALLTFKDASLQSDKIFFWRNVGYTLLELNFQSCDVGERLLIDILKNCPNLRTLHIIGCNGLFISGTLLEKCIDEEITNLSLPFLIELNLASNRYLSDALFNKLISVMPNVRRLSFEGCQITFHNGIFKRFYPKGIMKEFSRAVFTFQNITEYFKIMFDRIRSINLSRTLLDSGSMKKLMLPYPNLEEIHLVSCEQLTQAGFLHLCNYQTNLSVLDLSLCTQLLDQTLTQLCSNLTGLQTLRLRRCYNLTDNGISSLLQLPKLVELDLSSCEKLTPTGLKTALFAPHRSLLRKLILSYCNVNDEVVSSLSRYSVKLKHLDLSYCQSLTDYSLHTIASSLLDLRILRLAWCRDISDLGLSGERPAEDGLARISPSTPLNMPMMVIRNAHHRAASRPSQITNFPKLVSPPVRNIEPEEPPSTTGLCTLKSLQTLDLCGCTNIADWGISRGVNFIDLHYLNLSLCVNVTDRGLVRIGLQNPGLETLILSQCYQLTDEGFSEVLPCLPRIRYLDIQGCKHLTSVTLEVIRDHCRNIKYLNITLCSQMLGSAIENLENEVPKLQIVNR